MQVAPLLVVESPCSARQSRLAQNAVAAAAGSLASSSQRRTATALLQQGSVLLGPGHLRNTALPGDPGNAVIAAHRDTFFRQIYKLNPGDDIYVERNGNKYHYVVTGKRVVQPTDLSVLDTTPESRLTLITCYPVYFIGPAPERLIVFAKLVNHA